jgi:hypothetical protein
MGHQTSRSNRSGHMYINNILSTHLKWWMQTDFYHIYIYCNRNTSLQTHPHIFTDSIAFAGHAIFWPNISSSLMRNGPPRDPLPQSVTGRCLKTICKKKCLFISFYTWSQLDTPSSSALCFGSLPRARIQQHSFRVDLSNHLTTDTTSMSDHTIRNICHVGHLQVKTATSTGPELS